MKKIVIDFETKKSFQEVGGKSNIEALGISVAGCYDYSTNTYHAFEEKELEKLEALLVASELVIGFNSRHFDLPLLKPYLKQLDILSLEQLDIMEELQEILGYRVGLEKVTEATLGVKKSGHGLQAIEDYKAGRIQAIKDYCIDDVKITKEVYEFGLGNGYIRFKGGWENYTVPVKFK